MHSTNPARALLSVALAQFMVTLDMTIVNVALPSMNADLRFAPGRLPWVVNAYALLFGGFLLLGGRAGDLFGQRRLLLAGTLLFAGASLAGGLAQNPTQLIVTRAVQGLGAAAMAPAALAVLTITQPEGRARARALGLYAAVSALGGAVGVLLGGLLTQYAGWRWVMMVNLPMALVVVVLAVRHVPAAGGAGNRSGRLDLTGALLATAGVGLLTFGVMDTDRHPWTSITTLGTLGTAVALLTAFLLWERRPALRDPLIRLGLLGRRSVAGANIFMLLLCSGQFAGFYFVSLYLQNVLDFSPVQAGAAFLPMCLAVVAAIFLSARLPRTLSARVLLVLGGLLMAAGFGWFGAIQPTGGFTANVLGASLLAGFGLGTCFVPLTHAATGGLPRHEAGMASALLNSSRQIGGAVGLAALVTAQTARTAGRLAAGATAKAAATSGYGLGLSVAGALLLAATLVALLVLPGTDRPSTPTAAPDARRARASLATSGDGADRGSQPRARRVRP